jgi:hypothetical protein
MPERTANVKLISVEIGGRVAIVVVALRTIWPNDVCNMDVCKATRLVSPRLPWRRTCTGQSQELLADYGELFPKSALGLSSGMSLYAGRPLHSKGRAASDAVELTNLSLRCEGASPDSRCTSQS